MTLIHGPRFAIRSQLYCRRRGGFIFSLTKFYPPHSTLTRYTQSIYTMNDTFDRIWAAVAIIAGMAIGKVIAHALRPELMMR